MRMDSGRLRSDSPERLREGADGAIVGNAVKLKRAYTNTGVETLFSHFSDNVVKLSILLDPVLLSSPIVLQCEWVIHLRHILQTSAMQLTPLYHPKTQQHQNTRSTIPQRIVDLFRTAAARADRPSQRLACGAARQMLQ